MLFLSHSAPSATWPRSETKPAAAIKADASVSQPLQSQASTSQDHVAPQQPPAAQQDVPDASNPFAPRDTTCDILVVDTAGFLKHCVLETMARRIVTIPEVCFFLKMHIYFVTVQVVAEVRDKGARDRMQLLPFEIEVRDPSPESIKEGVLFDAKFSLSFVYLYTHPLSLSLSLLLTFSLVVSFSKLTGDFVSLSPTDIRVMALTLMMEVSVNGTDHIHKVPKPVRL